MGVYLTNGWASRATTPGSWGVKGCHHIGDGQTWTPVATGTTLGLWHMHGSHAHNVWAAPSSEDTVPRLVPDTPAP